MSMTYGNFPLLLTMALSSVLQIAAAMMAIRLIRPSGVFTAWLLLAGGFIIQGVRRAVALFHVVRGQYQGDLTVEFLGLVISALMLAGILKFGPLFDELRRTQQGLLAEREKLTAANRELEAFVSTVSHDLRTPLTVMIGYAEHLREICRNDLDEQALACLGEIEGQGERMMTLLEDLLALATVGHVAPPAEPVDANRVLELVLSELDVELAALAVTVKAEPLPWLNVPETLLAEIFKNLVGNALRYACREQPLIEVGGKRSARVVRLYVRDHGPGIPEGERCRIFEMFYRGSTGRAVRGSGIGLAVVQKIAQHYGGSAWVEETPRGGSTFVVELVA
jgi:signal transduction histidine kinase